jgi:DNA-binding transcriptional MerR regulator
MLSIGHFARHGRVSVRMLRHYDAIGLLQPAYVDRDAQWCQKVLEIYSVLLRARVFGLDKPNIENRRADSNR